MIKAIFYAILIMLALIVGQISAIALATDTQNILNNGSFDDTTNGWDLQGNVSYDGNTYSGGISKSVRFKNLEGGSIEQSINLSNIIEENKTITSITGTVVSIGCNNIGSKWCTEDGTVDNLDPVNITITLNDGTTTETLTHNYTSDYNDGVITTDYELNVESTFITNETQITVNYEGLDKGDWTQGKYGTIIDDLSVVLSLDDIIIAQPIEVPDIVQIETLTTTSQETIDDIQTGIIDITPNIDTTVDLSNTVGALIDVDVQMPDVGLTNDITGTLDVGAEVNIEDISIPVPDMPDIEMPEIEMPDIEAVEPVVEDIDIEENINNEEQETTEGALEENVAVDENSDISEPTENKEKEQTKKNEVKTVIAKNEVKTEKTTKNEKNEKKTSSQSPNKADKKSSEGDSKAEITSDIVVQELDLPTIVSFNKEYFEQRITDTLDLTTTEVSFYEPDGFNSYDYAQANTNFFDKYSNANSEWDMVSKRDYFKIKSFRRDSR